MLISSDGWIYFPRPNRKAAQRLFCFPGMGASASLFFPWAQIFPSIIEVGAVQLPGRTPELDLPAGTRFSTVIEAVAEAIACYDDRPFAFFGHSLGAILAFEVARHLGWHTSVCPERLFFACALPPHLLNELPFLKLSASELASQILVPLSVMFPTLCDAEYRREFAILLQNDVLLWKGYHAHTASPFTCPLTIYEATHDHFMNPRFLPAWERYTTGPFTLATFAGDHFFFYTDPQPLVQALSQQLLASESTRRA